MGKQGNQTHLAWKLETPKELGDVQKDLCIGKDGSLSLSIKVHTLKFIHVYLQIRKYLYI